MSAIPSVDLKDFVSGDQIRKQKFINEIGSAFENIGFVALKSHFLSDELVAKLYQEIKLFFELPQNIKDQIDEITQTYSTTNPEKSIKNLVSLYSLIEKELKLDYWKKIKLSEIKFGKRKKIPSSYVRPPMITQHIVPDFF